MLLRAIACSPILIPAAFIRGCVLAASGTAILLRTGRSAASSCVVLSAITFAAPRILELHASRRTVIKFFIFVSTVGPQTINCTFTSCACKGHRACSARVDSLAQLAASLVLLQSKIVCTRSGHSQSILLHSHRDSLLLRKVVYMSLLVQMVTLLLELVVRERSNILKSVAIVTVVEAILEL